MSKIVRARVYAVNSLKFNPIVLELETDEGFAGIGEATVAYGVGGLATAAMIKEFCERIVLGRDSRRIEALWHEMYDTSSWAKGGGPITFAAMSAIEMALWDIKGKRLGVPTHDLLGGLVHEELAVYANGWNFDHLDATSWAKAAERPLKDGYTAIKCYPLAIPGGSAKTLLHPRLRSVDHDLIQLAYQRVKELRNVVGSDITIRLDFFGGLTPDVIVKLCRRLQEFEIDWIEEPADPFDELALNAIKNQVMISVAAGERLYTRFGFRRVIENNAVDIVQPDVGACGGLLEAKKIAAMAEAYCMRFAPHNSAGAISTAASAQVGASTSNFMTLEVLPYYAGQPGYVAIVRNPIERRIKNGLLRMDDTPGLGVELDRPAMDGFLWAACEL